MKKLLSSIMSVILIFTVIGTVPVVSAEEIEFTVINQNEASRYWEKLYNKRIIVKSGDWYYACNGNTSNNITIVLLCGYGGDETDITFPTKFLGVKISSVSDFYFMSDTVKTVRIPKEITSINKLKEQSTYYSEEDDATLDEVPPVFEGNSKLEDFIVEGDNEFYASKDGVLFTKNYIRLIYYPTHKASDKYIVPETVKYITSGAFINAKTLKSLTITPSVEELGYSSIPKTGLDELRFENTILPELIYYISPDIPEDDHSYPRYLPDVTDTVVYCIKGSEMYKLYKESLEEPEGMCKELKVLPEFTETLKKESDGKWYYYNNDYKVYSSTLVKYKGKWFYVKDGVWDKSVTDKIIKYKDKWFYIKNGKWNSDVNTLIKLNGEWFGIVNGKWDTTKKTLVKYNGKWFYVKNGKWCKDTAIVKYKGKRFYVKKGKVDFDYSGTKKINGKTYKIKNGKVA